LGRLIDHHSGEGGYHAWVVYQCEDGGWEILEPVSLTRAGRAARDARHKKLARGPAKGKRTAKRDIEYVPHFVFNRDHLWRIRSRERQAAMGFRDYLGFRIDRFWTKFDPAFAVKAHEHIFDQALAGILSPEEISQVKHQSFIVDVNVLDYDPRDHFDFAYVPEGWKRVQKRLASGSIADFGLATHAIGDFYAHSFYAHCVPPGVRRPPATLRPDRFAGPEQRRLRFCKPAPPGVRPELTGGGRSVAGQAHKRSVVALVRGLPR